ncbi:diacylglycerol/lipid kinase family protein [Peribacillus sp. SCS-155]|uniref:diacylglycerol/lipid kinase family protein n=1 Tax=Peribacillus sedimenti TaxID=3115297 RepID=UPI003905F14B
MVGKKGMLIYHSNAGKGKIQNNLEACVPILSPGHSSLLVQQTFEPGEALDICRRYGEDLDVIYIMGGDGTVHECVNGLSGLSKRPVVGILPAGTCNDFSRSLGIPQNLRRAAETMLSGQVKYIDVGKANHNYFLNFWGIGLITETSKNIDTEEKSILGKLSYLLSAVRTIGDNEQIRYKITYDGKIIEDQAILVLVTNGNYIGTNKLPFPLIEYTDGLLDVIIVKNSDFGTVKQILSVKRTERQLTDADAGVMYFQSKEITIETLKKVNVDMDGEVYTQTPCNISLLPRHLPMIYGDEF